MTVLAAAGAGFAGAAAMRRPRHDFDTGPGKTVVRHLANPGWRGDIRSGSHRGERLGTC